VGIQDINTRGTRRRSVQNASNNTIDDTHRVSLQSRMLQTDMWITKLKRVPLAYEIVTVAVLKPRVHSVPVHQVDPALAELISHANIPQKLV